MAQLRVLVVGLDPAIIDFTAPEFADSGLDAAKIQAGMDAIAARLGELGYHAEFCTTDHGETAGEVLRTRLEASAWDCVVIGAGVRLYASQTALLETLVNTIHTAAPQAKFAFNTNPGDTAEAVQRWLVPAAGVSDGGRPEHGGASTGAARAR